MNQSNLMPNVPFMMEQYAEAKVKFEAKHQGKNYDDEIFAIAHRIIQSEKYAYLQLGVYWWVVKKILKARGYFIAGDVESPALMVG